MTARFGTMGMMAGAVAATLAFYTMSLGVSAERMTNNELKSQIASDLKAIRALETELRTRSRLPQLERWNNEVLSMSAPAPKQFVRQPVMLAAYAAEPATSAAGLPEGQAYADATAAAASAAARHVSGQEKASPSAQRVELAALTIPEPRVAASRPAPAELPDAAPAPVPEPRLPEVEPLPAGQQQVRLATAGDAGQSSGMARTVAAGLGGLASTGGLTESLIGQIENRAATERMFRTISMQ